MDENSAVVYFEKSNNVILELYYFEKKPSITFNFEKPNSCKDAEHCICLMQGISTITSGHNNFDFLSGKSSCVTLEKGLKMSSCSISSQPRSSDAVAYRCHNGFVLERNSPKIAFGKKIDDHAYLQTERRQDFLLEHSTGRINIIPGKIYDYQAKINVRGSNDAFERVGVR